MKRVLAIFLSIIFLFGNIGFSVATHYCGGDLVKSMLTLSNDAIDCGMNTVKTSCDSHSKSSSSFTKKRCCDNKYLSIDVDDNIESVVENVNLNFNFLIAFTYIFIKLFNPENGKDIAFRNYIPPPFFRNTATLILFQTFLI